MFYETSEKADLLTEDYIKKTTTRDYKVSPLSNYKLQYMGGGKLLRLSQTSLEKRYRGKGALCLEYDEGYYFPGITLYLPEGRDLATQGFMMWK